MASSSALSREELEKLTVTQLKEKLKGRKLPVSGTKAELVARLFDDILSEETILGGSGAVMGHEGAAGSIDLANLDVDAVLGLPSDAGSDSQSDKPSPNPTKSPPARIQPPSAAAKTPIALTATAGNGGEAAKSPASSAAPTTPNETAADKKVRLTAVSRMGLPISEESEAKAKRAARFGGAASPTGATSPAPSAAADAGGTSGKTDEAKARRIARFGPISAANGDSTTTGDEKSGKKTGLDEDGSKALERAKRFGLPLASSGADSTLQPASGENRTIGGKVVGGMASDGILSKRARRFGGPSSIGDDSGEEARKKQARLERFGSSA